MHKTSILYYKRYYFFFYGGVAALTTLFNIYLKDQLFFNNTQVGMIAASAAIISVFSQLLWGMVIDYTQKPKQVMRMLIAMATLFGTTLIIQQNFLPMLLHYLMTFFFISAIFPLMDSVTVGYLQHHKTGISFGYTRSYGSVGFAVLALLMGYITNAIGLQALFYIFMVMGLFAFFSSFGLSNDTLIHEKHFKSDLKALVHNKSYLYALLVIILLFGVIFGSYAYLGLFLQSKGLSFSVIGWVFFFMAGIEVPFLLKSDVWIRRLGERRILILVIALTALRLLLMSLNLPLGVILVVAVSRSVIIGLTMPTIMTMIAKLVAPGIYNTAISLYSALGTGLISFLLTLLGGRLSDLYGYPFMYQIFALIASLSLILSFKIKT